jgi:hypothetical protein
LLDQARQTTKDLETVAELNKNDYKKSSENQTPASYKSSSKE